MRTARALSAAALVGALATFGAASGQTASESAQRSYDLVYEIRLLPKQHAARVEMRLTQRKRLLREVTLSIEPARHLDFAGDGEVTAADGTVRWLPPAAGGVLSYTVEIDHLREPTEYDARCTSKWALFRGGDLFPPSASRSLVGSASRAELRFRLPPGWRAETALERLSPTRFRVDQPHRALDRPSGWMLVGKLDVTTALIDGVAVRVAAPAAHDFRSRDLLALLRWTLPELGALGKLPERLLVVGADDPMWRGGLSGPDSVYLHQDRPLIEPDGTSPLLHELMHVVTNAVSGEQGDWIVEGLAEYYSVELLHRSGTTDADAHRAALKGLADRGRGAESLLEGRADATVTARAVSVLARLDAAIREVSNGARSLDDVVRLLGEERRVVTRSGFEEQVARAAGKPLDALFAELVN